MPKLPSVAIGPLLSGKKQLHHSLYRIVTVFYHSGFKMSTGKSTRLSFFSSVAHLLFLTEKGGGSHGLRPASPGSGAAPSDRGPRSVARPRPIAPHTPIPGDLQQSSFVRTGASRADSASGNQTRPPLFGSTRTTDALSPTATKDDGSMCGAPPMIGGAPQLRLSSSGKSPRGWPDGQHRCCYSGAT